MACGIYRPAIARRNTARVAARLVRSALTLSAR
jgi:hypothetical protein